MRIILVRHAEKSSPPSLLTGRSEGIPLSVRGHEQARALARRLHDEGVVAVWHSPLQRARETADPIARGCGVVPEAREELQEFEIGEWTGRTMEDLADDEGWTAFNTFRSLHSPPGGESFAEVQARMLRAVESARRRYDEGTVVFVSHGDPIKAAVLGVLGMPLDHWNRFDIAIASLTTIELSAKHTLLVRLNETCPVESV